MAIAAQVLDEEGRSLLDTIDELRRLSRISHEIPIPQVIVVGQQSSGKSSVLSAISQIPFPTEAGLCTQFATEIVCRRSLRPFTKARIEAHNPPEPAKQARLEAFATRWNSVTINTQDQVGKLIAEARVAMGLTADKGYSNDKVIIEIEGPTQDHLTVIDLPGLISTDDEGMKQVDALVSSYLYREQTIILGIVHGYNDRQSQRLFNMGQECWDRTIGVITAADMVDWKGNGGTLVKYSVSDAAERRPRFGWHIVRNLKPEEVRNGKDRDMTETEFFDRKAGTEEWKGMEHVSCGIDLLRKKLSSVLRTCISSSLPDIQRRVEESLEKTRSGLHALGDDRSTHNEQKHYLTEGARKMQDTVRDSLEGRSDALDIAFEGNSLRDKVRKANELFAEEMLSNGHTWKVKDDESDDEDEDAGRSPGDEDDEDEDRSDIESEDDLEIDDPRDALRSEHRKPYLTPYRSLLNYISQTVGDNQGRALRGTFDPVWVGVFFLQQSRKWKQMVLEHVEEVTDIVESELTTLVYECVGQETGDNLLESIYEPNLKGRREKLREKANELLSPYLTRYPATLNRLYEEKLVSLDKRTGFGLRDGKVRSEWDINLRAGAHIYHCMQLYYNVAINVLLDNVQSLGIENVLLQELEKIFQPESVANMSKTELEELASESEETTKQRKRLRNTLRDLEQAQKLLNKHVLRRPLNNPFATGPPGQSVVTGAQNSPSAKTVAARNKTFSGSSNSNNSIIKSPPRKSAADDNASSSVLPVTRSANTNPDPNTNANANRMPVGRAKAGGSKTVKVEA